MNHIDHGTLKLRFKNPLLIEAAGDLSRLESPSCEVADVYICPHNGGTWTVLHVPGGTLPCRVDRAMPVRY